MKLHGKGGDELHHRHVGEPDSNLHRICNGGTWRGYCRYYQNLYLDGHGTRRPHSARQALWHIRGSFGQDEPSKFCGKLVLESEQKVIYTALKNAAYDALIVSLLF